jgi:tyrosyl-tRNA synthetase
LDKVQKQIKALDKEMESKVEKHQSLKNIVDSFIKEGYVTLFQKEIEEDQSRIAKYAQIQASMTERAHEEQGVYQNFEKRFFQELEEFVIKKKIAAGIQNKLVAPKK